MTAPDAGQAHLRALADGTGAAGIVSVCSAHPDVLAAACAAAAEGGGPLLIEATCNQVNHRGGYTGLTPAAFRDLLGRIAAAEGLPADRLILGGDHLGPNPWRHRDAAEAMAEARAMVAAYARAGCVKLHLDCSMGCRGEPEAVGDAVAAARAADLAEVAEAAAPAGAAPVYVIGTEVPVPGGVPGAVHALEVTRPEAARATVEAHRAAFAARGLGAAFGRVIALVVQPGVEFGHDSVIPYDPDRARALSAALKDLPGLVYEAHSTDYQTPAALRALVRDGFAILKVGPALTFALREALYGLEEAADVRDGRGRPLRDALEAAMLADPSHWASHYRGDAEEQRVLRHVSLSDRLRYYWGAPGVAEAVAGLFARHGDRPLPPGVVSQHIGTLAAAGIDALERRLGRPPVARDVVRAAVARVLGDYAAAVAP